MKLYIIKFSVLFAFIFANSFICLSQTSKKVRTKYFAKDSLDYRFYLKAEVLQPMIRLAFAPKTVNMDLQATVKLFSHFYWVNTYGLTTYDLKELSDTTVAKAKLFRIGKEKHRSSSTIRYFPFNIEYYWYNMLFVDFGYSFSDYRGKTHFDGYDMKTNLLNSSYTQELHFYRYGPIFNIGLSQRYGDRGNRKNPIAFSPEVFIGFTRNNIHLMEDKYTIHKGTFPPEEAYVEDKYHIHFRFKLGIGFL